MRDEKKIRRLYLQNRKAIEDMALSQRQHQLLASIRCEGAMTARQVAKLEKVSIQNASCKLTALYRKGWLTRDDVGDPTGGKMFVYKCVPV